MFANIHLPSGMIIHVRCWQDNLYGLQVLTKKVVIQDILSDSSGAEWHDGYIHDNNTDGELGFGVPYLENRVWVEHVYCWIDPITTAICLFLYAKLMDEYERKRNSTSLNVKLFQTVKYCM